MKIITASLVVVSFLVALPILVVLIAAIVLLHRIWRAERRDAGRLSLVDRLRNRLPVWETIYGVDAEHATPYMTRGYWGGLRLHIFHRGDNDPDCHDHPWSFWTFPLTSYVEEVLDPKSGKTRLNTVKSFRLHYRPAEYAHRVLYRVDDAEIGDAPSKKIVTLVWAAGERRPWGFWRIRRLPDEKCWVPWRKYIYGGGKHAPCEPVLREVA